MKHIVSYKIATPIMVAQFWLILSGIAGQDRQLTELLARLADKRFDRSILYALEGHPYDRRILPALQQAFESRVIKNEKQAIAVSILRLGGKSDKYFNFLADYARAAVEDRTPFYMKVDANGQELRGEFSAEFLNWCALNGKAPQSTAALQVGAYPEDVLALARAQDPRALPVLRRALDSPYPNVVSFAVEGLGRLQDIDAIPLIAKAAERLPQAQRVIAMALPWYARPEADALMERLEPDRRSRNFHKAQVERGRLLEIRQVLRRASTVQPK
jgi:hypothetical protein